MTMTAKTSLSYVHIYISYITITMSADHMTL